MYYKPRRRSTAVRDNSGFVAQRASFWCWLAFCMGLSFLTPLAAISLLAGYRFLNGSQLDYSETLWWRIYRSTA